MKDPRGWSRATYAPRMPRPRAPRTLGTVAPLAALLAALLVALLLPLGPASAGPATEVATSATPVSSVSTAAAAAVDVRLRRPLLADTSSQAARAAKVDRRFAGLARVAQARWYTDALPVAKARATSAAWAAEGIKHGQTPVVAIYALPGRDCGGHSAGGFDPATYRAWISELARGLRGSSAVAVLEPDALALLGSCAGQEQWLPLLQYAAQRLQANGVWVYLDAGHSSWVAPDVMAGRLAQAGIQYARGFAANTSNYRTTAEVTTWARQVTARLATRGAPGRTALIDTSRNGAGPPADGGWCNVPTARVGTTSRVVNSGGVDFYAWIKRPGESDGTCNGGPKAGQWWPAGALRLLGLR